MSIAKQTYDWCWSNCKFVRSKTWSLAWRIVGAGNLIHSSRTTGYGRFNRSIRSVLVWFVTVKINICLHSTTFTWVLQRMYRFHGPLQVLQILANYLQLKKFNFLQAVNEIGWKLTRETSKFGFEMICLRRRGDCTRLARTTRTTRPDRRTFEICRVWCCAEPTPVWPLSWNWLDLQSKSDSDGCWRCTVAWIGRRRPTTSSDPVDCSTLKSRKTIKWIRSTVMPAIANRSEFAKWTSAIEKMWKWIWMKKIRRLRSNVGLSENLLWNEHWKTGFNMPALLSLLNSFWFWRSNTL